MDPLRRPCVAVGRQRGSSLVDSDGETDGIRGLGVFPPIVPALAWGRAEACGAAARSTKPCIPAFYSSSNSCWKVLSGLILPAFGDTDGLEFDS